MLAADQLGEIFRFLIGIAPAADLVDAKVRVRAIGETDRGRRPRHFLHRDDMFEIAEAKPAELFLDGDAVQPEVAHLRSEEHTSELQSLMRISYAVSCLKKKKKKYKTINEHISTQKLNITNE